MVVVKEKRGRAAAGKHRTRPVKVHRRTVPMLTEEDRQRLQGVLAFAAICALVLLTGLLEGSAWPN